MQVFGDLSEFMVAGSVIFTARLTVGKVVVGKCAVSDIASYMPNFEEVLSFLRSKGKYCRMESSKGINTWEAYYSKQPDPKEGYIKTTVLPLLWKRLYEAAYARIYNPLSRISMPANIFGDDLRCELLATKEEYDLVQLKGGNWNGKLGIVFGSEVMVIDKNRLSCSYNLAVSRDTFKQVKITVSAINNEGIEDGQIFTCRQNERGVLFCHGVQALNDVGA